MKKTDLKNLNPKELESMLIEAREKLAKLRIDKATGSIGDTSEIKKNRKLIARILTLNSQANLQVKEGK